MQGSRRRFLIGSAVVPAALLLTKVVPSSEAPPSLDNSGIKGFDHLMELHTSGLLDDRTVREIMNCHPTAMSFSGRRVYLHYD